MFLFHEPVTKIFNYSMYLILHITPDFQIIVFEGSTPNFIISFSLLSINLNAYSIPLLSAITKSYLGM